jgi:hypothetical protein
MYWIRWFFKELWWYLTYEHYGRRRLRPATWGLLFTLPLLAAFYLLALGLGQQAALPGERPAPTLPPLTKTAIFAAVTATAQAPTRTPVPRCPEDPRLWQLVPLQGTLRDPKTGQPIRLPKPPQRIEPSCVYEGLARDLAHTLVPNPDVPAPSVEDKVLSVPWFWAPGMEAPQIQAKPRRTQEWGAYYDAQGKRIDELYLPYTAVATKDPDFPVLVYVFVDIPEAAWLKGRQGRGGVLGPLPNRRRGGDPRHPGNGLRFEGPALGWCCLPGPAAAPHRPRRAGGFGGGPGEAVRIAPLAAFGTAGPRGSPGSLPRHGQPCDHSAGWNHDYQPRGVCGGKEVIGCDGSPSPCFSLPSS